MAEAKAKEIKTEEPRTVTIRVPREKKDQDDLIVWVNDKRYLIKRGVAVEVPVAVAQIIANSEAMLQEAYDFEEKARK